MQTLDYRTILTSLWVSPPPGPKQRIYQASTRSNQSHYQLKTAGSIHKADFLLFGHYFPDRTLSQFLKVHTFFLSMLYIVVCNLHLCNY